MASKRVLIGECQLDWALYPRYSLNALHAQDLKNALRAGAVLPPIRVEKGTLRVVDGFHRWHAHESLYGPEGTIEVEEHEYASEADFYLDCVRTNAGHGQKLSRFDQAKIASDAERLGIAEETLAQALCVPADLFAELKVRKTAFNENGERVPIKASVQHLAQTTIPQAKVDAIRHMSGMKITFWCSQVVNALEGGLVDPTDRVTWEKLAALQTVLSRYLTPEAEASHE